MCAALRSRLILFVVTTLACSAASAQSSGDGGAAVASRVGSGVVGSARALSDLFAGLVTQLNRVPGSDLSQKATNLVTQFACLKGRSAAEKTETAKTLLDLGRRAQQSGVDDTLKEKLEIAKEYWPWIIRPLGGLDGVFNTGDTGALMSCLPQSEIDGLANQLIVRGAYGIIDNEVANVLGSLRPFIARSRIAQRKAGAAAAEARSMVHGMYESRKWDIRSQIEEKGKEHVDRMLTEVFGTSKAPFREPSCHEGEGSGYSQFSPTKGVEFVQAFYGINLMDMGVEAMWAKHYGWPTHFQAPALPESIASTELGVELRFPRGIPITVLEDALTEGKLPRNLILGARKETRQVEGKSKVITVVEIEPQRTVFGVNFEERYYQRPDGKYVAYPTVIHVYPGSPAERSGVKAGDYVKSIGGKHLEKVLGEEDRRKYEAGEEVPDQGTTQAAIDAVEHQARLLDRRLALELRTLERDGQSRRTRALTVALNHPCEDPAETYRLNPGAPSAPAHPTAVPHGP